MPTSNIKATLRDYSIHDVFNFDADGIALLGMCIDLPVDAPKDTGLIALRNKKGEDHE